MRPETIHNNGAYQTSPDRAPWFCCLLDGPNHIYAHTNDIYNECFGNKDFIGASVFNVMREIEGQEFFPLLRKVYESGRPHHGDSTIILGDRDEHGLIHRRVIYSYSPVRDPKGNVTHIATEGRLMARPRGGEVTAKVKAVTLGPKTLTDTELLSVFLEEEDGLNRALDLLHRFGTLRGVFAASPATLNESSSRPVDASRRLQPPGILRLKVASELQRRILFQRIANRPLLGSSRLVRAYLKMSLACEPREQFRVLFLDSSLKLIADEMMGEGTVSHVAVYTREVVRRALELSADSMILVHNHPSGVKAVSVQDVEITKEIVTAARILKIEVHDHLIVAGDEVVSLQKLGLVTAWGIKRGRTV